MTGPPRAEAPKAPSQLIRVAGLTLTEGRLPAGAVVLGCVGQIRPRTVPTFRDALRIMTRSDHTGLVVDLSQATLVGCGGLQALAAARHRLTRDCAMVLVTSSTEVLLQLRRSGLDRLLPVFVDQVQADQGIAQERASGTAGAQPERRDGDHDRSTPPTRATTLRTATGRDRRLYRRSLVAAAGRA